MCTWDANHIGMSNAKRVRAPRNPLLPPTATVREWAVRIGCAPVSVEREILRPGSVTGLAGQRIRKGLTTIRAEVRAWEAKQVAS